MKNSKTIDVVGFIFLFAVLGLSLAFSCNKDNSNCMNPDTGIVGDHRSATTQFITQFQRD